MMKRNPFSVSLMASCSVVGRCQTTVNAKGRWKWLSRLSSRANNQEHHRWLCNSNFVVKRKQ